MRSITFIEDIENYSSGIVSLTYNNYLPPSLYHVVFLTRPGTTTIPRGHLVFYGKIFVCNSGWKPADSPIVIENGRR